MGTVVLALGIILLAVGIIVGIQTESKDRRNFAIWVTVIGVGFTIAGIVILS